MGKVLDEAKKTYTQVTSRASNGKKYSLLAPFDPNWMRLQEKATGAPVCFQALLEDTPSQKGVYTTLKTKRVMLVRGSKCREVCVVMYDALGKKWKSCSKGSFALSCMGLWTKNVAKEAGQVVFLHGQRIKWFWIQRLREVGSDEEIFTSVAWIRAFNINEPIYAELFHEFYSTYEFNEVCVDDELQPKKIIKFILGGRAYNLTLLEFAQRLGLYQAVKLKEEGFNVYFEGGFHNVYNFNAQDY
uniref:Uncharacterized protein n=1 Tax=Tanacetum cinerariifolium TaxID=118510 RepID=A0A6L2NZS9_TANCI|nr:hypothetical protein [Tanacetum cinerariifolium]